MPVIHSQCGEVVDAAAAPAPLAKAGVPPNELIAFLLPGLTHSLGNALFAIHGHAQALGVGSEVDRARRAILRASAQANHVLELLSLLQGAAPASQRRPAGAVLRRLVDYLRVPLRSHGLHVRLLHPAGETSVPADRAALCQSVAETVRQVARALPQGFFGGIDLEIAPPSPRLSVAVRAVRGPALLPFPAKLGRALEAASAVLTGLGVGAEAVDGGREIVLSMPAAAAHASAAAPP